MHGMRLTDCSFFQTSMEIVSPNAKRWIPESCFSGLGTLNLSVFFLAAAQEQSLDTFRALLLSFLIFYVDCMGYNTTILHFYLSILKYLKNKNY